MSVLPIASNSSIRSKYQLTYELQIKLVLASHLDKAVGVPRVIEMVS